MRRLFALCVALAAPAGCTAIDDFGKFQVAGDLAASDAGSDGGCIVTCATGNMQLVTNCGGSIQTISCACLDASPMAPAHCLLPPSNVTGCASWQGDVFLRDSATVPGDRYDVSTASGLPTFSGPGVSVSGTVVNNVARFCLHSLSSGTGVNRVIHVSSSMPVVFVSQTVFNFSGLISVGGGDPGGSIAGSGNAGGGSGGAPGQRANGGGQAGNSSGGGGGGGNLNAGGNGGGGPNGGAPSPGGSPLAPGLLLGGQGGGGGALPAGGVTVVAGGGGGGGGAFEISSSYSIQIAGSIDATGGGGGGGGSGMINGGGGGGGGAGGTLWLEAPNLFVRSGLSATAHGCLSVFGGAGGSGASTTMPGADPRANLVCPYGTAPGSPVPQGAGVGGDPTGQTPPNPFWGGNAASAGGAGGGGAGSPGHVYLRGHNIDPLTTSSALPGSSLTVIPQ